MALVNRYQGILQGAMVLTGNALQIRQSTAYPPGNDYTNGSYISTNTGLVAAAGFPPGTTFTASQASATATLNIPSGSTVVFAQLFWNTQGGTNAAITLTTPLGANSVTPNVALNQVVNSIEWRAQDVTAIVNNAKGGNYTVSNITGNTITNNGSIQSSSWYLIVVYKNTSLPYRFFSVNTGSSAVSTGSPSDFTFSNIVTPSSGVVKGYLLVSEANGDLGDAARISVGTSLATATQVGNSSTGTWNGVAPYAQIDNMLPGNILIADTNDANIGLLDTRGTFGTYNKNPFAVTAPGFARNITDILGIDISNKLTNNQTSLFTRVFYSGSGGGVVSSQSVQVDVNSANLTLVKNVDKAIATTNDTLVYTVTITNGGLANADNVVFIDTLPAGTTFVPGSVIIDNTPNGSANPQTPGINLGSIATNAFKTVTFSVKVSTTLPSPNPLVNSADTTFNFTPGTGITPVYTNAESNDVQTQIYSAVLKSTKSVTAAIVTVGDEIFYTIGIANSGNMTANNVVFIDTIPNGTTFVPNSLTLNGATQTGQSPAPPSGFPIGTIAPNAIATITFKVTVNTIPTPNPVPNSSYTNFNYISNPNTGETVANTSVSNIVETSVSPDSNPVKAVSSDHGKPGDILTYTIQWQNRLSITATDVVMIDTIPNDTTFIANSVTVNGVTISGATVSPPSGINLGTIPSGVYTTVTFNVLINTIPNPNPIPNQAYGRYSYISNPALGTVTTETVATNIVTTQVNYASIPGATKAVNRAYAKVGDVLTYTIAFTNIGNVTATNVKFIDTIPSGTSFNTNSVFVNNVNQPGAVVAPPTGLTIGSLAPNARTTVVFSITVDTVPSPNPIPNTANVGYDYTIDPQTARTDTGGTNTNTVNTQVNYATLGTLGKTADKAYTTVGNTILYTITIRNTGNTTANGVVISDTIPNNTSFVNGSALVNGVSTATVPTGNVLRVSVGSIAPNGVASLSFKVNVDTIPTPNPIPNSANTSFTYTVDPALPNGQSSSGNTNIVTTQVNNANLGSISKSVDKAFATCGDILTYTISIPNNGNITATNVVLSDTVPNGTVLVASSILVNGTPSGATSPSSIPIGTINPGATATVSFKVQVVC